MHKCYLCNIICTSAHNKQYEVTGMRKYSLGIQQYILDGVAVLQLTGNGLTTGPVGFLTSAWKVDHNDSTTFIFAQLSPTRVEIESVLL